ncbi:MAG: hypothetical protein LJE69_16675 [Thiohalocapsa sp.]|jgi:hypothetical protein|uniref:hypothetical protein n=1 Tax=Thiohalocapsa sp. TaxID=2497641 RepID=UPI0025F2A6BB|nr:hypothetical protein [Thiohalocapsa sp.]MCG6942872.1 hypothetical protein [Thiohalocapsa sp.]
MSSTDSSPGDDTTLREDSALDEPLRRVAYEAGMLLGLEATRAEQTYHRRRLTRQQYWLHGAGTIAGLRVWLDPAESDTPDADMLTRVLVGPGLAIDALGRELMITETHCLDLRAWLQAQSATALAEGTDGGTLRLLLTVRYADCPVAAQPVLARKLNLSTDAVQPSRIADGVALTLAPEPPAAAAAGYHPWPRHPAVPELTADEEAAVQATTDTPEAAAQLRLHARLLHLFDDDATPAPEPPDPAAAAKVPLARLSMQAPDLDNIVVNPAHIAVDNLIRPFVTTAAQLARLARGG